ncbi:ABC transporter permease, partial [Salmonella enterica subsp. enterica serovar Senftenberg]|nr:ABC transporter permease [Salmonella enterica subsp. enterica serovar Senftenberg]
MDKGTDKGMDEGAHKGTDKATTKGKQGGTSRLELVQRVALPVAWLLLIAGFGIANPSVFLTAATFQTMLGSQAVLLVLTLALIVPLTAGDYDLSVAGVLTLSAMMVAILNVQHGWPIWAAIVAALVMGLVVGLVNGLVMVFFGIESLIVTLGMGTLLTGITLWASDSATISGISQGLVDYVIVKRFAGISLAFYYAIALCAVLWWVLEYTSIGRRLLFVGRGRSVSKLSGVRVGRVRVGALMGSAVLAALAGVLYAGTSGGADPSSGSSL